MERNSTSLCFYSHCFTSCSASTWVALQKEKKKKSYKTIHVFHGMHVMSQIMAELHWWTTLFSTKSSREEFVFVQCGHDYVFESNGA